MSQILREHRVGCSEDPGGRAPGTARAECARIGHNPPEQTILVVDDDEMVREFVRCALGSRGYPTLMAKDGVDALEVYSACADQIALVLLDMLMPRMTGMELIEHLKKLNSHVRVLAMSGYLPPGHEALAGDSCLVGFLPKPFSFEKLLAHITEAMTAKERVNGHGRIESIRDSRQVSES
ncbi:MAG: response regulator [Acidobacteria bacterium]|nr:response regulator [Acidobacteriota bacterium]